MVYKIRDTGVVLPAAGSGVRMGGIRKQHRLLGGAPVWLQTLRVFCSHSEIGPAVVVANEDELDDVSRWLEREPWADRVQVVSGGSTRQQSVYLGLRSIRGKCEFVLVHDAVRPFVSHSDIERLLVEIRRSGAASLAIPVVDTLRTLTGNQFDQIVPRESTWRMQTPQGFRYDRLVAAHERARMNHFEATDDVALVQALGDSVSAVPGRTENIKVTTSEDWEYATMIWETWIESKS